jgi:hypothetical protein
MRHLGRGGNRLGRYGIAAQALKGTTPHPLWLDRDGQCKGSLLLRPAKSRAELVGTSARSLPHIFTLALISETVTAPTAEYASPEIEH